jgi:hypothetical protein
VACVRVCLTAVKCLELSLHIISLVHGPSHGLEPEFTLIVTQATLSADGTMGEASASVDKLVSLADSPAWHTPKAGGPARPADIARHVIGCRRNAGAPCLSLTWRAIRARRAAPTSFNCFICQPSFLKSKAPRLAHASGRGPARHISLATSQHAIEPQTRGFHVRVDDGAGNICFQGPLETPFNSFASPRFLNQMPPG